MKIIHTGDIHIGASFAYLSSEKARIRRAEMLDTFHILVNFAKKEGVSAVLIVGDLFDNDTISLREKQEVFYLMDKAKPLHFYYIQGNHDEYLSLSGAPENLHLFQNGKGFQSYELGENVTLTGVNTADFSPELFSSLRLDAQNYNLLMLHGDITKANDREGIPLELLKNKGIDYLALGHIHKPMEKAERLDGRGKYRYCGCLEGRGFDECGKRGAFLLEIKNGYVIHEQFCSFAKREVCEVEVDISSVQSYYDIEREVFSALEARKHNMIKVRLVGRYVPTLKKELALLKERANEKCFFVKIEDESKLSLDLENLKNDVSELGEFIKEVSRYEMSEKMRQEVLEIGIKALCGEEIDL